MEKKLITLIVNDVDYELYINPKTLLVEAIRDHIGLTGTKRGCETVSCGACTVMIDDMAVKSCSVLAVQAEGRRITTQKVWRRTENWLQSRRHSSMKVLTSAAFAHRVC